MDKSKTKLFTFSSEIEVSVIKKSEKIPPFLDGKYGDKNGIILRISNNKDEISDAIVQLNSIMTSKIEEVIEVDLLERYIESKDKFEYNQNKDKTYPISLNFKLKPHEIRTFKLILN